MTDLSLGEYENNLLELSKLLEADPNNLELQSVYNELAEARLGRVSLELHAHSQTHVTGTRCRWFNSLVSCSSPLAYSPLPRRRRVPTLLAALFCQPPKRWNSAKPSGNVHL